MPPAPAALQVARAALRGAAAGLLLTLAAPAAAQGVPQPVFAPHSPAVLDGGRRLEPVEPIAATHVPANLLALPQTLRHVLLADLERNRLFLYAHRGGELELLRSMYLSIGRAGYGKQVEGDLLSPVGIYTIVDWLPGERLPPLYGDGAWPVDYPNALDHYEGRTGHGIWLHGNPPAVSGRRRAPRSSEGCLTLANSDLRGLADFVRLRETPLIFADRVDWLQPGERVAAAAAAHLLLEQWEVAWESLDAEELASFYWPEARIGGLRHAEFRARKAQVNAGKDWIDVRLEDVAIYRYPGPQPRLQVDFTQHYDSSNYAASSRKRQYWEEGRDGRWRILLETEL